MDDDPVLRALGDDLERDDPELAALLRGAQSPPRHHHSTAWTLLAITTLTLALISAPAVTMGVLAMLLVLASPLVACWWGDFGGDEPVAGRS